VHKRLWEKSVVPEYNFSRYRKSQCEPLFQGHWQSDI